MRITGYASVWIGLLLCWPATVSGDGVVIANRTIDTIGFRIRGEQPEDQGKAYRLEPGRVQVLPTRGPLTLVDPFTDPRRQFQLDPNAVYFFTPTEDAWQLQRIDLGGDVASPELPDGPLDEVHEITVKILVDDEEPAVDSVWQARLRKRVEAASDILERYCLLRLRIVGFENWDSDDAIDDFGKSLREFEEEVDPQPAMVAIGFAAQFPVTATDRHLGGTRGIFRRHILIREWAPGLSESERLEILLHELGHFLGATHSPEFDSVMRPRLADGLARDPRFRIGFDAVNTLVMYLVAEQYRLFGARTPAELSLQTRNQLSRVYTILDGAFPDDVAARQMDRQVALPPGVAEGLREPAAGQPAGDGLVVSEDVDALVSATRWIVESMAAAALRNAESPAPRRGDALTEYYVRTAALAAQSLPFEVAHAAFLRALGITLDDSDVLLKQPLVGDFYRAVESDSQRAERIKTMGKSTIWGRRDLAQHFFVSVALTSWAGPAGANTAGLAKEVMDSRGGSGFSFADLAADKAGVELAARVLDSRLRILTLARSFSVPDFMPAIDELPEGIPWEQIRGQLLPTASGPYQQHLAEIERRIEALYRPQGN